MYRIYYGDGSTYEGPPEGAPVHDVQVIIYDDQALGRGLMCEWDFYIYSDRVGGWHGTNKYHDLLQHLALGCGPGGVRAVLLGRWLNQETYNAIKNKALTDSGFAPRSATAPARESGDT